LLGNDPAVVGNDIQAKIMGITPQPQWVSAWTSFTITQYYGYIPPVPPTPSYPVPSPPGQYPTTPYGYVQPPFAGYPGATYYYLGGQWLCGVPPNGIYWYWENPCGISQPSCGTWRLRIKICIGCGSP
jgi:hypothetical protein